MAPISPEEVRACGVELLEQRRELATVGVRHDRHRVERGEDRPLLALVPCADDHGDELAGPAELLAAHVAVDEPARTLVENERLDPPDLLERLREGVACSAPCRRQLAGFGLRLSASTYSSRSGRASFNGSLRVFEDRLPVGPPIGTPGTVRVAVCVRRAEGETIAAVPGGEGSPGTAGRLAAVSMAAPRRQVSLRSSRRPSPAAAGDAAAQLPWGGATQEPVGLEPAGMPLDLPSGLGTATTWIAARGSVGTAGSIGSRSKVATSSAVIEASVADWSTLPDGLGGAVGDRRRGRRGLHAGADRGAELVSRHASHSQGTGTGIFQTTASGPSARAAARVSRPRAGRPTA